MAVVVSVDCDEVLCPCEVLGVAVLAFWVCWFGFCGCCLFCSGGFDSDCGTEDLPHAEGIGASVDNDDTHLCHNFVRSDPDLSNFSTIWP